MAALEPIGTVVLDLDDTLILEEAAAHASLRAAAALAPGVDPDALRGTVLDEARRRWHEGPEHPLCAELGFASWEGLWATFEGGHPRLDGLRRWAPGYRQDTWRAALAAHGVGDGEIARRCADAFVANQRKGHPLLPGAAGAVEALRARYRLGLLTNGPPDIQRAKLEATGLAPSFEAVVISGVAGVGKPDPAVFALALEALDAERGSTLMVGDSWERDVVGAQRAGWRAVWIAAGRPRPSAQAEVVAIDTLADLPALLEGLADPARSRTPVPPAQGDQPKVKS